MITCVLAGTCTVNLHAFFYVIVGSSLRFMVMDPELLSSSSPTLFLHVRGKFYNGEIKPIFIVHRAMPFNLVVVHFIIQVCDEVQ